MTNEAGLEFDKKSAMPLGCAADQGDTCFLCKAKGVWCERAALSSPRVPVIDGLDEAITVFEKGVPDLADYEIVGVYLADCEKYEDRCHMVAEAARAYAALPKMKKVDLGDCKLKIVPSDPSEFAKGYVHGHIQAIDDIKSKYGELYAEVKE